MGCEHFLIGGVPARVSILENLGEDALGDRGKGGDGSGSCGSGGELAIKVVPSGC